MSQKLPDLAARPIQQRVAKSAEQMTVAEQVMSENRDLLRKLAQS